MTQRVTDKDLQAICDRINRMHGTPSKPWGRDDAGGAVMSTAYTPGPWHTVAIGHAAYVAQAADDEGRFALASVFFPSYHPNGLAAARIEQQANARLIAAAPQLVEALQAVEALARTATYTRFGKPEWLTEEGRIAREHVRELAQRYAVAPCATIFEQAGKVSCAALRAAGVTP